MADGNRIKVDPRFAASTTVATCQISLASLTQREMVPVVANSLLESLKRAEEYARKFSHAVADRIGALCGEIEKDKTVVMSPTFRSKLDQIGSETPSWMALPAEND